MTTIFLFVLGLAIGSFINVVSLRYLPGGRLISRDVVFGRSYCPRCRAALRWYELVPLFSFVFQLGRCLRCRQRISWQYPLVELLVGLVFAAWPLYPEPAPIWVLAILAFIAITLIDLRLSVIPDQLNLFIVLLGVGALILSSSALVPKLIGAVFGLALFGLIILASKGRGMGAGDLKMSAALGFLFGWPKIALLVAAAFVIGGIFSAALLVAGRKKMKDAVPFGPFLSTAAILVIFFGDATIMLYGR